MAFADIRAPSETIAWIDVIVVCRWPLRRGSKIVTSHFASPFAASPAEVRRAFGQNPNNIDARDWKQLDDLNKVIVDLDSRPRRLVIKGTTPLKICHSSVGSFLRKRSDRCKVCKLLGLAPCRGQYRFGRTRHRMEITHLTQAAPRCNAATSASYFAMAWETTCSSAKATSPGEDSSSGSVRDDARATRTAPSSASRLLRRQQARRGLVARQLAPRRAGLPVEDGADDGDGRPQKTSARSFLGLLFGARRRAPVTCNVEDVARTRTRPARAASTAGGFPRRSTCPRRRPSGLPELHGN